MLAVGLLLLSISNGRWSTPTAIWIGAPLTLAALRLLPPTTALGCGALGFVAVFVVQAQGVVNLPPPASLAIGAGFGLVGFIAYAADRLAAQRLNGTLATLVFPLALCTVEFLTGQLSPYGTFGSLAYSQAGNLPLLQVLSITGLWGVTFIIGWFASTAAALVPLGTEPQADKRIVIPFAAVAIAVLVFGEARLRLTPTAPTVRLAGVSPTASDGFRFLDFVGDPCSIGNCEGAQRRALQVQDELFAASRREAQAGARAILWSENAGTVFKSEEAAFVARGRQLAREEQVTLVMALQVLTPDRPLAENKAVVIAPSGDVTSVYKKARPVPGDPDEAGDGRISVESTPFGRIAAAICFDLDFPVLMRQVGRGRADILFVPASDWHEISALHARMAVFRGIENGVSLMRETRRGLSIAADPLGRPIATMDFFGSNSRTLVANVPVRGTRTFYPLIGDAFAWAGLIGLLLLPLFSRWWPKIAQR